MSEISLLAIVVSLAAVLGLIVKRLRLPLIVSYICAGALLSAFHIVKPEQLEFLAVLPEIGLALLLFLVGMELDFSEFKSVGRKVLVATCLQIVFTTLLVAVLFTSFGLQLFSGVLVGLAVSMSSTILMVKLLVEKDELSSLHGKLSLGISLVEDFVAVAVLMFLGVASKNAFSTFEIFFLIIKCVVLLSCALFVGKKILPRIFKVSADGTEMLFLVAISWCFLFVAFSTLLGFSVTVGAFLAGVSLGQSDYRTAISGKIKPLRDFFIMLFFLDLGTGLSISGIGSQWIFALIFLLYAVVFKPLFFFLLFTGLKLRAHVSFQTAIYVSSISEFSLILISYAAKTGLVSREILSALIFGTVFSFIFSSLMAARSREIYLRLRKVLKSFEESGAVSEKASESGRLSGHAVLIGCHRSGQIILAKLRRLYEDNLVVVDYNPEVVENLRSQGIKVLYGDAIDSEVNEELVLGSARLVVSTVRDVEDNLKLLDIIAKFGGTPTIVITASDTRDAVRLYERGAHHVSIPMNLEGTSIAHLLSSELGEIKKERERKLEELKRQF